MASVASRRICHPISVRLPSASMTAMTLLRDAKQFVEIELSATMLWNNPTLASFAAHVAGLLIPDREPEPGPAEETTEESGGVLDALFDSVEEETR